MDDASLLGRVGAEWEYLQQLWVDRRSELDPGGFESDDQYRADVECGASGGQRN
jgi:hypothetical protein